MSGEVVSRELYEDVLRRERELQKKCDELLVKNSGLQKDLAEKEKLLQKVCVFPYLRLKFELYSGTWDCGWRQTNFTITDSQIPPNLFGQTKENFKDNWLRWYRVLSNSNAPGATRFVRDTRALYPGWTVKDIAKHVALFICLLNNSMHGPTGAEAFAVFHNPTLLINALKQWNVTDPVLLNVVEVFERVTTS